MVCGRVRPGVEMSFTEGEGEMCDCTVTGDVDDSTKATRRAGWAGRDASVGVEVWKPLARR
jgi:hypothetical protein